MKKTKKEIAEAKEDKKQILKITEAMKGHKLPCDFDYENVTFEIKDFNGVTLIETSNNNLYSLEYDENVKLHYLQNLSTTRRGD